MGTDVHVMKRELVFLLSFARNFVVAVRRSFLFIYLLQWNMLRYLLLNVLNFYHMSVYGTEDKSSAY